MGIAAKRQTLSFSYSGRQIGDVEREARQLKK
jgi:hypothetical protein